MSRPAPPAVSSSVLDTEKRNQFEDRLQEQGKVIPDIYGVQYTNNSILHIKNKLAHTFQYH